MPESTKAIVIRAATIGDRPHLVAMLSDFADYLNAISPAEFDKQKIDYLVDLSLGSDPICTTCLAERGGVPIGYVAFHAGIWEIYKALYVVSLFVRPQARRSGAGRALMEKVREIGRNAGAERLVWFVWKKNPLAIEFYRGLGASVYDDNHLMAWPTT
jgi:ribosomal protein S18 acetylase RimI-like enzyme